jgi:hypothetical protein
MPPRSPRQRRSAEFRLRSKAVRPHRFEISHRLHPQDEEPVNLRTSRVPMPDIPCARASCGFGNPRPAIPTCRLDLRASAGARSSDSAARWFARTASKLPTRLHPQDEKPVNLRTSRVPVPDIPCAPTSCGFGNPRPPSTCSLDRRASAGARSSDSAARRFAHTASKSPMRLHPQDEKPVNLRTSRVPVPDIPCAQASCGFGNPRPASTCRLDRRASAGARSSDSAARWFARTASKLPTRLHPQDEKPVKLRTSRAPVPDIPCAPTSCGFGNPRPAIPTCRLDRRASAGARSSDSAARRFAHTASKSPSRLHPQDEKPVNLRTSRVPVPDVPCARASCGFGNPRPAIPTCRLDRRASAGARSSDSAARRFAYTASKSPTACTRKMKSP